MLRVHRIGGAAHAQILSANLALTDAAHTAIAAADEVWLELAPDSSGSPLLAELGVDTDRALSVIAGEERWARIVEVCGAVGLDHADLDILRPWLAAQMLDAMLGRDSSDDAVRMMAGGRVRYEMVFDVAVRSLAALDDEAQFGLLDWTIELLEGLGRQPVEDQAARLRDAAPVFHQRMVVARNRDWALRIEELVDEGKTVVVSVSGIHLAGADGIPALLADRGLAVELVE